MNCKHRKKAVNGPQDWSLNLDVVHPNAAGIDILEEGTWRIRGQEAPIPEQMVFGNP
jgi:hypothetical protein